MNELRPIYLLNGLLYAAAGILLLLAALAAVVGLSGVDLRREICEHRNLAAAALTGALAVALAIIIAAALH
jgi:uncharacterized membrane protein YjfL (UPF0719 family)